MLGLNALSCNFDLNYSEIAGVQYMYMTSSQHAGTFDHKHHSGITSGCDIVRLCIRYVLQFLVMLYHTK